MPELPDVVVYLEALEQRIVGRRLERLRILSPFVLRSVDPAPDDLAGRDVSGVRRIGKRLVLAFGSAPDRPASGGASRGGELFLVLHLMIAGRLRWRAPGGKPGMGRRQILAALAFDNGTLFFTEAGSTRRASLQIVRGDEALRSLDPGGLEPIDATLDQFRAALQRENHTVKRALTDPRLFSGIGNAYSDEILHAARLSPLKQTRTLSAEEIARLYGATRATLLAWIGRLRREAAGDFPEKVTAFRAEMAVHGRFGEPCPVCGAPVQRIRYAENECNYCARCQTEGRRLADRSLSRLLKDDWPRSIDEA